MFTYYRLIRTRTKSLGIIPTTQYLIRDVDNPNNERWVTRAEYYALQMAQMILE